MSATIDEIKSHIDSTITNKTGLFAIKNSDVGLVLKDLVDFAISQIALLGNAAFSGLASPSDAAITPTSNIWKFSTSTGTYTNYLSAPSTPITVVTNDGICILSFDFSTGYWRKVTNPQIVIANDLITSDTSKALSAAQGIELNSKIQGVITGTGTIDIDSTGATTLAGSLFAAIGSTYIPGAIPPATTAGLSANGLFFGLNYIYLKISTQKVYVVNYSSINSVDKTDHLLIGWNYDLSIDNLTTNSNITINGKEKGTDYGTLSFLGEIKIDRLANKIIIPSFLYSYKGEDYVRFDATDFGSANAFTFDLSTGYVLDTIIFDPALLPSTNPFYVESAAHVDTLSLRKKIVVQSVGGFVTSQYNFDDLTPFLSFAGTQTITGINYGLNVDSINNTITVTNGGTGVWITTGTGLRAVTEGTTARVGDTYGLFYVIFNKNDGKIYYVQYGSMYLYNFDNCSVLGSFFNYDVQSIQGNLNITIDGVAKKFSTTISTTNNATGELILPPKFFLLQNTTLPLYKRSIVRSVEELKNETVLMVSGTDTDLDLPLIESFNVAKLNPATLVKSTVRIYSKKYEDTVYDYGQDVSVVSVNPGTKSGNYYDLAIGDSLTNRGVTKYTKNYLAQFGIITTGVGTLNNSGQLGEGREGWTFKNFIGADNYHTFLANAITPSTSGTTTNMDTQNPFLKIATSGDKSTHPTWCFRNTGSHNELSYTTDTDKTGVFYIFDFAAYLSNHSVPTPHVVTIALSTNDLTFYSNTNGVISSLLGAEIMISQIRAALPTVPIGIIPNVGFGDNNQNEWDGACNFINQLNTKLATMALTRVDVVGVHAHMDKRFAFDYAATANLTSDGNLTKKYSKGESVHFNLQGYLQYAKARGAYIANVL